MNPSRSVSFRLATIVLALTLPLVATAGRREGRREAKDAQDFSTLRREALDPAFAAMLGASAPQEDAIDLASRLRVVAADGADAPLAPRLVATPSTDGTRYEGSGLPLKIRTIGHGDFVLTDAHVLLAPSADGSSCRFELSGVPFGAGSRVEASGTVRWNSGPFGGHRLEAALRVDGAPVETLRKAFPKRFDASVGGVASLEAKAAGIVGETTTEDAPATPLKGHLVAKAEWTVLGRRGPLTVDSDFSLDDRRVRLMAGRLGWQEFDLALQGWFTPTSQGPFDLTASFSGIDSGRVAGAWNVPAEWTPSSTLAGRFTWKGEPGESILRYEASAPVIDLPAWGGWPVHIEGAKLSGGILEVNLDASASVRCTGLRVGDLVLPPVPGGLQWWRGALTFATAKVPVWDGTVTMSIGYKPAEHPAFSMSGALIGTKAEQAAAVLLAPLGLDVDGRASMAWTFGQDGERHPKWTVHGSLLNGRVGNVDLVAKALDALAAADASLALSDAASLVPQPRKGKGLKVDRLFVEVEKKDGVFLLGGLVLGSGDFGFEGDGSWTPAGGLDVAGTLTIPEPVAARLVAAAPWLAALRSPGGVLLVPLLVRGPTASPSVALDPSFATLLAAAHRGDAVAPVQPRAARHVGVDNLASIPGDPDGTFGQ